MLDPRRVAQPDLHLAAGAFVEQQLDDLARGAVAEELAQRLLVPGDAVTLDQVEEILRGVAAERGLHEMRVLREVAIGRGAEIGEVAAATARDQDLLARRIGMIDEEHALAPLAGGERTHEPRGAGSQDDRVVHCGGPSRCSACGKRQRSPG